MPRTARTSLLLLFITIYISRTRTEDSPIVQNDPPGIILQEPPAHALNHSSVDNSTTSSSSSEASLEEVVLNKKPAAVKFSNANGQQDEASLEEFRDQQQQRIMRRENETHEEMLRLAEERRQLRSSCFHVPEEFCELRNFTAELPPDALSSAHLCPCKPHPFIANAVLCCNVTDLGRARECLGEQFGGQKFGQAAAIHIRNATLRTLNMANGWWRSFERISVTDGRIERLAKSFANMMQLQCLNVSNNNISEIDSRTFKAVKRHNFTVLDLSQNNLTQLPNVQQFPNLTVNIRDNHGMLCKVVQEAVNAGMNFAERNQSKCGSSHGFRWFNSTDLTLISQMYLDKELQRVCPRGCKCALNRISYAPEDTHPFHTVRVDCSSMGLVELPEFLPANTVSLNVSNNNITNLHGLNLHESLVRLYLDNNQISSLLDLEGTAFKDDFEVLSLRGNKLKQIPIYLLTKTIDKSPLGKRLYFANNRLNCDCNSATELRLWLLGHKVSVKDYDLIKCDNLPDTVIQLMEAKLCQSKHEAMDYIFYLIAAEVLLLLALILKVSYDYYVFKTQSYLPWPANKMPKLPCDWLCES